MNTWSMNTRFLALEVVAAAVLLPGAMMMRAYAADTTTPTVPESTPPPTLLEQVLASHPAVAECAVIGVHASLSLSAAVLFVVIAVLFAWQAMRPGAARSLQPQPGH